MQLKTEADEEALIRSRVKQFRDHPALLAWYLNDELPQTYMPRLEAHQRWVAQDDNHFTSEQDTLDGLFLMYLRTGDRKWDITGLSAIEIGIVFALIAIISGSIWARPIWNTWWTWDPRLTTATIMELAYAAYLMLRAGIEDPERRARFGAVYAIIAFVSVPLTFFSIRLFNTIHPVVIAGNESGALGSFAMTPSMRTTFFISLIAFSFIFVDLFWHRIRMGKLAAWVEQQKLKLTE